MTTEQQIEALAAISERFPDGRVAIPTEQTLLAARATLGGLLDGLPEDAKLIGSSIQGDKIIVKYWV